MGEELKALWEPGHTAYVCGSPRFAEAASQLLIDVGVPDHDIRIERFGPSAS
jgi:ferredoxin-NADP reductase